MQEEPTDPRTELERRLAEADQLFHKPGNSLGGFVKAVDSIFDFLCASGVDAARLSLLASLHMALVDHSRGVATPLLAVRRRSGRPPRSGGSIMLQSSAAAAVTLLMEAGQSRKEASQRVARFLEKHGLSLTGSAAHRAAPLWRSVQSVRDKVMNGHEGNAACQFYEYVLAEAWEKEKDPNKAAALFLNLIAPLPKIAPLSKQPKPS